MRVLAALLVAWALYVYVIKPYVALREWRRLHPDWKEYDR